MPYLPLSRAGPGLRMHYVERGDAGPPIVFVHGFGCSLEDWEPQLGALSGEHRCLACDLVGHGHSSRDDGPHRVEDLGEDVAALLAARSLTDACLVGHSMGCRVILQAFALAPERVNGLVFVDGSAIGSGPPEEIEAEITDLFDRSGYRAVIRRLFEQMFLPGDKRPLRDSIIERGDAVAPETGRSLFKSMVVYDATRTVDVLDLAARRGTAVAAVQSTDLGADRERRALSAGDTTPWLDLVRRHVPGARIGIVPGAGHFTMLDAPDAVSQVIADLRAA